MATINETYYSLRFKHGIHTIFLFIDSLAPFSETKKTLMSVLRDRYPNGLTASVAPPKTTPIPSPSDDNTLVFAILHNPQDPTQGWKPLDIGDKDSAVGKGLQDGNVIAFNFSTADADDDESSDFPVDWPTLEDYAGDEDELEDE